MIEALLEEKEGNNNKCWQLFAICLSHVVFALCC